MKGIGDNTKVFVPRSETETFSVQPGNQEQVSIIECISSQGYILLPYIIFEGKNIMNDWIPDSISNQIQVQISPNSWTNDDIALEQLQYFHTYTTSRTKGVYRFFILNDYTSYTIFQFVQYYQDYNIIPLYLLLYSTHYLQPLDIGIFGSLTKAYRIYISQGSIFRARRIDNYQFLLYYIDVQKATISQNILSVQHDSTSLSPFDLDKILQLLQPKSTPCTAIASTTIVQVPDLTTRVDKAISQILPICDSPLKYEVLFIKDTVLTTITDRAALQTINQGLVDKSSQQRRKRTNKNQGEARALSILEIRERIQEREAKEAVEEAIKARNRALCSKLGFAKLVLKEFQMDIDIFI